MSALPLTDKQIASLIKEARAELVERLITECKDELDLITTAQAAGILDVNPVTLSKLPIPRYVFVAGKLVKYRLSEVRAYVESRREA